MMGFKAQHNLSSDKVKQLWREVARQVVDRRLFLGTRLDVPERRDG
jgi:hypothetical protein